MKCNTTISFYAVLHVIGNIILCSVICIVLTCHYVDKVTHFCKNTDKTLKYNNCQSNSSKKIDHTVNDAQCTKGYKLTVILAFENS